MCRGAVGAAAGLSGGRRTGQNGSMYRDRLATRRAEHVAFWLLCVRHGTQTGAGVDFNNNNNSFYG